MAENLNRISTFILPSIPINVSVASVEHEARRKAKITWLMRMPHNHHQNELEYIIEARAHIGNSFSKYKLSQWFVLQAENTQVESVHSHNFKCVHWFIFLWTMYGMMEDFSSYSFRLSSWISLQIGRFYEFRIAAINENGTRGYSATTVFQLNESKSILFYPSSIYQYLCCKYSTVQNKITFKQIK